MAMGLGHHCSESPVLRGKFGKCSRKEENSGERTRKGASEVNSTCVVWYPLHNKILIWAYRPLDTLLCSLTNTTLLHSPLHLPLCNQTWCLFLASPLGLYPYLSPLPEILFPRSFGQLLLSFRSQLIAHPLQNDLPRTNCLKLPVLPAPFVHLPSHPCFCYLHPLLSHAQMVSIIILPHRNINSLRRGTWLSYSALCPTTWHAPVTWIN